MTDNLTKKLRSELEAVIKDGMFISGKEYLIQPTEHFDPQHDENPMTARINRAEHRITQAFIDAGWLRPPNIDAYIAAATEAYIKAGGDKDFVVMSQGNWDVNRKLANVMTGQEWYDKYEKELQDLVEGAVFAADTLLSYGSLHREAAKKAAGISS